jgi:hypothetical protein
VNVREKKNVFDFSKAFSVSTFFEGCSLLFFFSNVFYCINLFCESFDVGFYACGIHG